ncbi:adenylate/guanylate cyclase domain-containing protein [Glaciecola sp. 1036]|uniref:adenylate/guanylate cyclase domain-containing protein n=1 Tax=Alteromonadaceae TaxID=72275 RepID=UPI003D038A2F
MAFSRFTLESKQTFSQQQVLSKVTLVMIAIIVLQSIKYLFSAQLHWHLINTLFHLILFTICYFLLSHRKENIGRFLLFTAFSSYISVACLIWQTNMGLHYFLLVALCVLSAITPAASRVGFRFLVITLLLPYCCFVIFYLNDSINSGVLAVNNLILMLACLSCAMVIRTKMNILWQKVTGENQQQSNLIDKLLPKEFLPMLSSTSKQSPVLESRFCTVISLDFINSTMKFKAMGEQNAYMKLHHLFSELDAIIQNSNAYRVKTNGDQLLCVVGLTDIVNNPRKIANNALSLSKALTLKCKNNKHIPKLNARCGIATGIVYANFTSSEQPSFDIWGETVVRAARLESLAHENEIIMDEFTEKLCPQHISRSEKQRSELKGLGDCNYYKILQPTAL